MQASDRRSKTGGERPQKKDSKFDPLQTSRAAGTERGGLVLRKPSRLVQFGESVLKKKVLAYE